jgi:hypothetical protein
VDKVSDVSHNYCGQLINACLTDIGRVRGPIGRNRQAV